MTYLSVFDRELLRFLLFEHAFTKDISWVCAPG